VHRWSRLEKWLVGALAVALLAVGVLGGVVYADHRQSDPVPGLTAAQVAAVAAVKLHLAALNTNDPVALRETMTADAVWSAPGDGALGAGPYRGEDYVTFMQQLAPSFEITTLGDPVVAGDTVVAVPASISGPLGVSGTGLSVFQVRAEGGTVKVSEILWIPQVSDR
jgi:hypothetical protein